jgi:TetR/AcrR family transcriptional regulator, lmrAB and yxaGH operons repressor
VGAAYHSTMARSSPRSASAVAPGPEADTRSRILRAALRLFRKHGYHGVGITDILLQAQSPKGSMYHHFPDGKEEIGAAVVAMIADGVWQLIEAADPLLSPSAVVAEVGAVFSDGMVRTRHELCALFAAFVAEKASAPRLAKAVDEAYSRIAAALEKRLRHGGFTPAQARDRAMLVVMLLEGGSLIAAARDDIAPFKLAMKQAVALCQPAAS